MNNREDDIVVYQFNDKTEEFEELILDPEVKLSDLLDEQFILLFVDSQHSTVWHWIGMNTTTRMKFISTKIAPSIRDKHGIAFRIKTEDQGSESHGFKVMIGLEKEIEFDTIKNEPLNQETEEALEVFESLPKEKILLILKKAGVPEGYERVMVAVKDQIYAYREIEVHYPSDTIIEPRLFPLKEKVEDGTYLAEDYIPRFLFSFNHLVLIEFFKKIDLKESERNVNNVSRGCD